MSSTNVEKPTEPEGVQITTGTQCPKFLPIAKLCRRAAREFGGVRLNYDHNPNSRAPSTLELLTTRRLMLTADNAKGDYVIKNPKSTEELLSWRHEALNEWDIEDEKFYANEGNQIARRNLWASIPNLLMGFAVWLMWSVTNAKIQQTHDKDPSVYYFKDFAASTRASPRATAAARGGTRSRAARRGRTSTTTTGTCGRSP